MKKLFILFFWLPCFAFAAGQPVSIQLSSVSLVAFAQATFKNMLARDFVISPEALALDRKITVSVSSLDADRLPMFVEGILRDQGIAAELRDGVYYLRAAQSAASVPSAIRLSSVDVPVGDAGAAFLNRPILRPGRADGEDGAVDPVSVASGRRRDAESEVYAPAGRSADFLAGVVAAAFGPHSAVAAGSQIVLTGSPSELNKMRILLGALDQLPRMVDVSASWVEVTDNASSGRGISIMASVLGAKFGASLGSVNSASAISLRGTNFQLVVDALNTDGRFKQVSNSRIVGDDYQKMVLTVGDETPTIASTGKDNSGNSVQNIVYRPSGVIVDVLPKVLGNGKINLAIDGQISSFKPTSSGVTGSPTLIKRQVKTAVTVNDGEVLLIGGLNDAQTVDSSSGFSFLPSSWAARSGTKLHTDLVLILSAQVPHTSEKR
ncbi:type II secretion system protein GspD [Janthinobacterium sp. GB1R12]|uniref:type II secretion system protein GspD n=1 Tax=Janthinobacterium sp. GB1R12 TaxID=3424190 RepID=UPI003F298C6E